MSIIAYARQQPVRTTVRVIALSLLGYVSLSYISLIQRPEYRYRLYPNHYQQTYLTTGPIDIIGVGSSRSQTAFQSSMLHESTRCPVGTHLIVNDYSRSLPGLEMDYVLLRDALEHHKVSTIYVEYKRSNIYQRIHPYFYQVATFSDLFLATVASNGDNILSRARLFLRLAIKKITNEISLALLGNDPKQIESQPTLAVTADPTPPQLIVSRSITSYRRSSADNWTKWPADSWELDAPTEAHSSTYVRRIERLAREHGAKVIFHHIPILYQPAIDDAVIRSWQLHDNIQIVQLDGKLREKLYEFGYGDGGHMNAAGAKLYMDWLANTTNADTNCREAEHKK